MSNFSYNKLSGTGNDQVVVTCVSANTGQTDISVDLDFTDSQGRTATVSVIQRYCPWLTQSTNVFPGQGGTCFITPHTEYDIAFLNVPAWIAITCNGHSYASWEKIDAEDADNQTFSFYASSNTGSTTRNTGTMRMVHYKNNIQQMSEVAIYLTQVPATQGVSIPYSLSASMEREEGSCTLTVEKNGTVIAWDNLYLPSGSTLIEGHIGNDQLNIGETYTLRFTLEELSSEWGTGKMLYTGEGWTTPTQLEPLDSMSITEEMIDSASTWEIEFWLQG